ncbi:MAG TPA: xanthine dehydrogenase family protein molybdopterin-binding subunit [Dongiaceae bacterium]|jgi:isoquinoline 1-oxidoreductase beta subunit
MLPLKLKPETFKPSRRQFLVAAAAAGAGLSISFRVPGARAAADAELDPFNGYVTIAPDNTVTILSAHMDMGQGCYFGIATLVAEELEADPQQLKVEGGAGNVKYYGNLAFGGKMQGTGGSTAMFSSFDRYRKAGALARTMLVNAAAKQWNVPAGEIKVEKGIISHASGKQATFGELADVAAKGEVPAQVALKTRQQWKLIGSEDFRRLDSHDKATGQQHYTIDVKLPGMLTAVVAHPPLFGAKVKSFDPASAKAVKGVVDVVQISRGVAVLADNTWAAMKGRDALKVEWDDSAAEKRGSADLIAEYLRQAEQPGAAVAANRGDVDGGLKNAAKVVEATYQFPYLAHAALEPMDAIAHKNGDVLEIWGGHQMPDLYQAAGAQLAGVKPENVQLHVMKTGGSFGRRAVADADVIAEAVETAKAIGWKAPVKVLWTREDDMRGGRYRPLFVHKVKVGLDQAGNIVAWQHRQVGQSILSGTPFEGWVKDGIDSTSVEGVSDHPYAIDNFCSEITNAKVGVPVLWWRSVGHTHTAYVMETMIDEIARETGKDPVELRRGLLKDHPRHLAVLNLAVDKAGWSQEVPKGTARGVALHESFGTVVAEIADIKLDGKGGFKVERVVCAVDCGTAINPDQVRAQMEGGIGFGLGAVLHEELTLTKGQVDQTNYDTYLPLRIEEMPKVEVYIVSSDANPSGVGEPGVPPIGPAVANALASANGKRVRILPFAKGLSA